MFDDEYLEKVLGEQYNMSSYFADTYVEPKVKIKEIESEDLLEQHCTEKEKEPDQNHNIDSLKDTKGENHNDETEQKPQYSAIQVNSINEDETNLDTINAMYPEIYLVLEPIVELTVKNNHNKLYDEKIVDTMTDKIYYAIDNDSFLNENNETGVIPTSSNEILPTSSRPKNHMLRDLIKILILNNLLKQKPPHHKHHNNSHKIRNVNAPGIKAYENTPYPEDE